MLLNGYLCYLKMVKTIIKKLLLEHSIISPPITKATTSSAANELPVQESMNDVLYKENIQRLPIQRKLSIGTVDDPLEYEADAMADQVMRMPESNFIQRKCARCEEGEQVQRKPLAASITPFIQKKGADGGTAIEGVTNKINSTKGSGSGMDSNTQNFMQSRFGTDFSGVKIHTGSDSIQMNRELNAKAFTVGSDIYFNEGQYQPNAESGKHLLAHELTHTVQQGEANCLQEKMIQRDLAVEPTISNPVLRVLTTAQVQLAINWNSIVLTDPDEVALIRDVIGLPEQPAVIDDDFVQMLVQYQADFGLTQDGMIGAGTALKLANELGAEATYMGADADVASATEMSLNTGQRRMRLRSRVANRLGNLMHQGFVGPRDNPTGIVTARSGVDATPEFGAGFASTNAIQLDYTGTNANNAHWLQFASVRMFTGNGAARVFNNTTVIGSGGGLTFSNATTTNWAVDTGSATDPTYDSAGANTRTAGSGISVFDQPQGWNGAAESFAASQPVRPATVTFVDQFDSYLVINNRAVYHVRWNLTFIFNTTTNPTPDTNGTYSEIAAGSVTALPANLLTVLTARFTTSPIR